jgi:hypothetical protein
MLVHHGDQRRSGDASVVMVAFTVCIILVPFGPLVVALGGCVIFLAFFFIPKRLSAPV